MKHLLLAALLTISTTINADPIVCPKSHILINLCNLKHSTVQMVYNTREKFPTVQLLDMVDTKWVSLNNHVNKGLPPESRVDMKRIVRDYTRKSNGKYVYQDQKNTARDIIAHAEFNKCLYSGF